MNKDVKNFLTSTANALLRRDTRGFVDSLASWLKPSSEHDAWKQIDQVERETRQEWHDEAIGPASDFEFDDNFLNVAELREDGTPLPAEVIADNFVAWASICVQADDGEWSLYDIWCAIVIENDRHAIGYYEVQRPD